MSAKTVSLSEDAYKRLREWKKSDNESFSEAILRILPKQRSVADIMKELEEEGEGLTEEEGEKMKKDSKE
jgi:predicted CopG family antitoxin